MDDRLILYQPENSDRDMDIDRRYYLNFQFVKNMHANPEFIYVLKGVLDVNIDGQFMEIPENHFCLVLPWQVHAFSTREYSRSVILVVANRYVDVFTRDMYAFRGETQVFRAEPAVRELFLRHLYEGPFPDVYIITAVLLGLCHCFLDECKIVPGIDRDIAPILYELMDYITRHCSEKLTLRTTADALGYSYFHLSHLLKEYTGMSFPQFCNMKRISSVGTMLIHTNKSITDILFECGFSNVRSFNRVFLEIMGITPSQYRRRYSRVINGRRVSINEGMVLSEGGAMTTSQDSTLK